MAKKDDVDWEGLMTVGSIFLNIVQSSKNQVLDNDVKKKEFQINILLEDRRKLEDILEKWKNEFQKLKMNSEVLQIMNRNLLNEIKDREQMIENLKSENRKLEERLIKP